MRELYNQVDIKDIKECLAENNIHFVTNSFPDGYFIL